MSTTNINRFKLKSTKVVSEKERYSEAKVKLNKMIDKHEVKADALSRHLITDKLLNDENIDCQELGELVRMGKGLSLNSDAETERNCQRNLNEIKTLTNMEVRNVTTKLRKVTDSDDCVKEWSLKILPDQANFPDVIIDMKMITAQPVTSSELPNIKKLAVDIEGLDIDSDLEAALEYCETRLEPQLVTELVREYLPLHSARLSLLDNVDPEHCELKTCQIPFREAKPNSVLEFHNSRGSVLLATLYILIKFKRRTLSWEPAWLCSLTPDSGLEARSKFNLPQELETTGTVEGWDWAYAVETLGKVAKLDEEDSKSVDSFDASNVDTNTPKIARGKVSKRKLN